MDLMKILRKRWRLTAALLILALIATGVAFVKLPWTYQSTGDVVVLPSENLANAYGGNPYLAFSSTINEMADLIRYEATDTDVAHALAAAGYAQHYTVEDAVDTSAPILLITVTGNDARAVQHTLTGVVSEISALLAKRQSGIRPVDQIRDIVVASTPRANQVASKKARPLLVVLATGLLFTVVIPVLADAVTERGRGSRSRPSHAVRLPERLAPGRAAGERRGSRAREM